MCEFLRNNGLIGSAVLLLFAHNRSLIDKTKEVKSIINIPVRRVLPFNLIIMSSQATSSKHHNYI